MGKEWTFNANYGCKNMHCECHECSILIPNYSYKLLIKMGHKKKDIFHCKAYNISCAIKEQDECEPEKCDWSIKCKMMAKLDEQRIG